MNQAASNIIKSNALVVDDDAVFRIAASGYLQEAGFEVFEAENGAAGLSIFQSVEPNIILLDAMMPDMDGFSVCRTIRASATGTNVPILMITGNDDIESVHQAFQAGASDFTAKTVSFELLIHRIRYMLRIEETTRSLRERENSLAYAQRIAKLGNWDWSLKTDHYFYSDQVVKILGLDSNAKFSITTLINAIHLEDREQCQQILNNCLQTATDFQFECRMLTPEGNEITTHHEAKFIKNRQGEVDRVLGTIQDITERRFIEDRIRKMAHYDALTGLPNRNSFYDRLSLAISETSSSESYLAIMFLDLDDFKAINDSLGHDAGDQLLKTVSNRLNDVLREGDLAARFGGDEFCILLEQITDKNDAAYIAERCLSSVGKPISINNTNIYPKTSIGIAVYPMDGDTIETLINSADNAMYTAKRAGKHQYRFFSSEMTTFTKHCQNLEKELLQALENDQFVLYFQPQVSVLTGRMIGVEALVRWQHPERGIINSTDFIPAIQKTNLMIPLEEWVLRNASMQMVKWRDSSIQIHHVAVNMSGVQFSQNSLIATLENIIKETGILPNQLQIEITEDSIQTTEDSINTCTKIQALGIKIAIDDFGTGYTCLSSLSHLPIDYLKIDTLFVHNMVNSNHSKIAETIVSISKIMGLTVIAEGVETIEQIEKLQEIGCNLAQGHYFSEPVRAEHIANLVNSDFFQNPKSNSIEIAS